MNANNGLRSALSLEHENKLLRHFAQCLRLKVAIFREQNQLEKLEGMSRLVAFLSNGATRYFLWLKDMEIYLKLL